MNNGTKHLNDSKAFTEYWNDMDNIYINIEEYNPNKKCDILNVFDHIIVDMLSNKKCNPIVAEWFIRVRKVNTYIVLILLCQNALFCYENSKQKRTSTNLVSSFISYLLSRLYDYLQKMYPKTIFFFSYWCYSCIR